MKIEYWILNIEQLTGLLLMSKWKIFGFSYAGTAVPENNLREISSSSQPIYNTLLCPQFAKSLWQQNEHFTVLKMCNLAVNSQKHWNCVYFQIKIKFLSFKSP